MTTPVAGVGTTPTTQATQATQAQTTTSSKTANGLLDPQAFLQLLVAQLQYQDPTNPTDTSTFMNQTAMLSQVQTMGSMSTTLTELMSAQQAQSATSMIGKQVTYNGPGGLPVTGLVTGATLSGTSATLTVAGQPVPFASVTGVSLPDPTAKTA